MVGINNVVLGVYILLEIIALILTVIGNFVVCYAVLTKQSQKKTSKYILSVSLADFFVGVFAIPSGIMKAVDNSPHSFYMCLYTTSFVIFIYSASMTSMLAVTIDRFWAICFPISYRKSTKSYVPNLIIIFWWILPFVFALPPVFGWNGRKRFETYENQCIVTTIMKFSHTYLCCFSTLLVIVTIIVLYCFIYRAVATQEKKRSLRRTPLNPDDTELAKRAEVRMAKTMGLIIGCFVIFWTPVTVNFLVVAITNDCQYFQKDAALRTFHIFSICIAHYNSAINPFIYSYRIKYIRDTVNEIFRKLRYHLFGDGDKLNADGVAISTLNRYYAPKH